MELTTKSYNLNYWNTPEWKTIQERLDEYEKAHRVYVPARSLLFRSLDILDLERVRVCIIGQDPYPNPSHATGIAFSVPKDVRQGSLPKSLVNIFKEYQDDLHYPQPLTGDLKPWIDQGVLLWNVYPVCEAWRPCSMDWEEWRPLTIEIVEKLDEGGKVVFILLGAVARSFSGYINNGLCIETSHPAPLGVKKGFSCSRIFSRANEKLVFLKQEPIDWRL